MHAESSPQPPQSERTPRTDPAPDGIGVSPAPLASVELTGSLSCIRCGYDLRGLSVVGQCPECSLKVRATLLARVDPSADELQPIRLRWLIAAGLVTGSAFAMLAALIVWVHRIADVVTTLTDMKVELTWGANSTAGCVMVSGLGFLSLVRPHRMHDSRQVIASAVGALLFVPLALLLREILRLDLSLSHRPFLSETPMSEERIGLSLAVLATFVMILLCFRKNLMALVARSKLMRAGLVPRQSLSAMMISAGVAAAGYILLSFSGGAGTPGYGILRPAATFVVAAGFMLLTVGLAGLVIDTIRLWPVIVMPPIAPVDVLGSRNGAISGARQTANDRP